MERFETRYPNEDFCLYKDFPFNQAIYIFDKLYLKILLTQDTPTCTFLWLTQFYPIYQNFTTASNSNYFNLKNRAYAKLFTNLSSKCDFKQKLKSCNRSNWIFHRSSHSSDYDGEFQLVADLTHVILIFLSPPICLFGLWTNILVIVTITSDVKKQKELKEMRHYDYMRLNSCVHCLILLVQLPSMLNECTHEFWCSTLHRTVPAQYFKIVVGEFLGTSLRFMSNFTYLGFTLSRLSLIGKEHGKLVMYVAKDKSIKVYLCITIVLSLLLSIVRYFRYLPNQMDYISTGAADMYPDKLVFVAVGELREHFHVRLFSIFNVLCDLCNYAVFIVVNLILDSVMVVELKKTLKEKAEKCGETEKQKRKNEITIKRAILMVVLNAVFNLVLKFPLLLNTFFEFYSNEVDENLVTAQGKIKEKNFIYNYFVFRNGSEPFELAANLFYFISISFSIWFFYKFDRNFQVSFDRAILKEDLVVVKDVKKSKKFVSKLVLNGLYENFKI